MSKPLLIAFLLADKVFREMETGKVHVAGTFNQLSATRFPMVHPQVYVYLALTDLKAGKRILDIEMHYIESGEKVVKVSQPMESPGPLEVIEFNLCFNHLSFRQPGNVELILSCDDEIVATRMLKIRESDQLPFAGGQQSPEE